MNPEEVKKLGRLARIEVDEATLPKFTKEMEAIIGYVGQLEKLELAGAAQKPALRNVMREDGVPNDARLYTEKIAAQFPAREGDYLVVKQIITHD